MEKFKCTCCGKEYNTAEEVVRCIISCSERIKRENDEKRKAELENERKVRKDEVQKVFDTFAKLMDNYEKDFNERIIPTDKVHKDNSYLEDIFTLYSFLR